jgi:chromosome segregation ATPase
MTITVEALLPWISFLAAIGAVITLFAKMRSQVDRSLEKDKEQDAVINQCAAKENLIKVEKRIDDFIAKYENKHDNLVAKVNTQGENIASLKSTIAKYEQKYDDLVLKVNANGEDIAGLKPALDGLRQSVDKLADKIDGLGLRSLT